MHEPFQLCRLLNKPAHDKNIAILSRRQEGVHFSMRAPGGDSQCLPELRKEGSSFTQKHRMQRKSKCQGGIESPSGTAHSTDITPPRAPKFYAIEPITAFYVFLIANIISALFAPIQDCDETFNYWEPTHYLSHGYGLQTWEYSPDFAIRSWLYIGLHAIIGNLRRLLPGTTKVCRQ